MPVERLAIISNSNERGRVWEEALTQLADAGIEPSVVAIGGIGSLHEQWRDHGRRSFALGCRRAEDYPVGAARLARLVRSLRIDVIHSVEPIAGVVGGLAGIAAARGLRVFHRQHTHFEDAPEANLLSRLASRLNQVTLACSWAAAEYAHELDRVPFERIRVAHNGANRMRGVSSEEIAAVRAELGISETSSVISAVARLRPEKGLSILIAAHPVVSRALSRSEVHVVIAGSGPDEAALQRQAEDQAPGRVHFVGHQDDVALWFAVGDVAAMPSSREALGIAGAEAMACGRPLVASAVGGLQELVDDGVTGVLVEPGNVEALAAGLCSVLADPERARGRDANSARGSPARAGEEAAAVAE
jgi:glycosyltransferase involved in cell wall biosynthesis